MPKTKTTTIGRYKNLLAVDAPYSPLNVSRCRNIPDYRTWKPKADAWVARPSLANIEYLRDVFSAAEWTPEAEELCAKALGVQAEAAKLREQHADLEAVENPEVVDYRYVGVPEPWAHQKKAFLLARDRDQFAFLMEQGTGKTKALIDVLGWKYLQGEIDGALIVPPNGVKRVWEEEIDEHLPTNIRREVRVWDSSLGKAELEELAAWVDNPAAERALKFFVVNVEGLSTKRAKKWALRFVKNNRAAVAVDESTRIKTPSAKRTKSVLKIGQEGKARFILTGTPATKNPLDLYAQFSFLDPDILGYGSFYAFRNHFAIMGGYEGKEIVAFTNLEELRSLIAPFSYRVTADECQDLPDKVYQRYDVDLTREQARIHDDLASEMLAEYDGKVIAVTLAITLYMRLQQIAGGFLGVFDEGREEYVAHEIEGGNPKLSALLEIIEDNPDEKVVIWSRFRPEIDLIEKALRKKYGDEAVVGYHGGVDEKTRTAGRRRFEDPDSDARFFVSNPQVGSMGLTLTSASLAVYFSNSFDLEDRLQSEKRTHRAGQTKTCRYVDIVARGTVDERIRKVLRDKKSLADLVTGDNWTEWLR